MIISYCVGNACKNVAQVTPHSGLAWGGNECRVDGGHVSKRRRSVNFNIPDSHSSQSCSESKDEEGIDE